jgi:hypothetical protein
MKGYKGFDKNFKCLYKQYEENKNFVESYKVKLCENGMHFCKLPLQTFKFYPPKDGNIYAKVEAKGALDISREKIATDNLHILNKMTIKEMFEEHCNIIKETTKNTVKIKECANRKFIEKPESYVALENTHIRAFVSGYYSCVKENQSFEYSKYRLGNDCF